MKDSCTFCADEFVLVPQHTQTLGFEQGPTVVVSGITGRQCSCSVIPNYPDLFTLDSMIKALDPGVRRAHFTWDGRGRGWTMELPQ
jgi:hypothetical protein